MVQYQRKKTTLQEEFDSFIRDALRGRLPKRPEETDKKEEEKDKEND
tara:strand:+ start:912 stop:1052 length:141 start_codon:yes stop_codon:yes gene_type:complete